VEIPTGGLVMSGRRELSLMCVVLTNWHGLSTEPIGGGRAPCGRRSSDAQLALGRSAWNCVVSDESPASQCVG
jgi:hypothetical protein